MTLAWTKVAEDGRATSSHVIPCDSEVGDPRGSRTYHYRSTDGALKRAVDLGL